MEHLRISKTRAALSFLSPFAGALDDHEERVARPRRWRLEPIAKTTELPMYALFKNEKQIGNAFPSEKEVWEAALIEGLVKDVPVADEEGGQVLPDGYRVRQVGAN